MRQQMIWLIGGLALLGCAFVTWSLTPGQESPSRKPSSPDSGVVPASASPGAERVTPLASPTSRDVAKMAPLQRQMFLSAQRGAEWLYRFNGPDGRFVYGYLPALRKPMAGDNFLHQAGATVALAQAARYSGDERHLARARQGVLTLLLATDIDPGDPKVRLPQVSNRLAAAGLIVAAINELPAPGDDLLEQSEQLCAYIRKQQQGDGSLAYCDDPRDCAKHPEGVNLYPGEALAGLMLSQRHQKADWKTDIARKALAYYRPWWREHRNQAFVSRQSAAYAEAFLLTKEPAFAEFVFEMNDWLCKLQYTAIDPSHPLWRGGFQGWMDNKPLMVAPTIGSASGAASLAEACRVTRQTADLPRYKRYREALEMSLQFLTSLQYTDANTTHFTDWYRPALLGGFFASHDDGNLRIDWTQQAVTAMLLYLTYVVDH